MKDTYSEESWIDIEKRHTAEKLAYFTKLSQLGVSKHEGARIAGISTSRMAYMLETMGIGWVFPERERLAHIEMYNRRKRMVQEGLSLKYIAEKEGITVNRLRNYIRFHGIKRRLEA